MRKFTLLFVATVFAVFSYAQVKTSSVKEVSAKQKEWSAEGNEVGGGIPYNSAKDFGVAVLGGSINVYGIMSNGFHQVAYSPELNTVAFVRRGFTDGNALNVDYSTDGGYTWVTTATTINTALNGYKCRYPGMTLYNPAGNTNVANARIVANGPALIPGANWGHLYQVDATIAETPVTNEFYGTVNGAGTDWHPSGIICGPDGVVWSASSNYIAESNAANYTEFYINKGTWNGSKIAWQISTTIKPTNYIEGGKKIGGSYEVAVHPTDGNIVYAVGSAVEAEDPLKIPTPKVWKSLDGGANWSKLPNFTWDNFIAMFDGVGTNPYIHAADGQVQRPYLYEMDVTVDAQGKLHILGAVCSGSENFGMVFQDFLEMEGGGWLAATHYVDFITSDGNDWEVRYVHPLISEAWEYDATNKISTYLHPSISRSPSGNNVFYFIDGTAGNEANLNKAPNIIVNGYAINDLGEGVMMPEVVNITAGTDADGLMYFPQISPIVIEKDGVFDFPIVVPSINMDTPDAVAAYETHYYLNGFDMSNWVTTGVVKVNKPTIKVFPNPVTDILNITDGNKVELYSITGTLMISIENQAEVKTIDMKNYPKGTYVLKVYTDNGVESKKIVNM